MSQRLLIGVLAQAVLYVGAIHWRAPQSQPGLTGLQPDAGLTLQSDAERGVSQLCVLPACFLCEIAGAGSQAARPAKTGGEQSLACNFLALDASEQRRMTALIRGLASRMIGFQELPNGYAIEFPGDGAALRDATEYISLEQRCCPFFDFELVSADEGGPVRLDLLGPQGIKEIVKAEFNLTDFKAAPSRQSQSSGHKLSKLSCDPSALNPQESERLSAVIKEIRASKQDVKELDNGYSVRLVVGSGTICDLGDYMATLRLCSPYFQTSLEVGCNGGPVWLSVTGRPGVKQQVQRELGLAVN